MSFSRLYLRKKYHVNQARISWGKGLQGVHGPPTLVRYLRNPMFRSAGGWLGVDHLQGELLLTEIQNSHLCGQPSKANSRPRLVAWRGGDRGYKVMEPGPRQALGGPGKTKSRASNESPGRLNHARRKAPGKWYMAVIHSFPGRSFAGSPMFLRPPSVLGPLGLTKP
jgi:hypothetical protein